MFKTERFSPFNLTQSNFKTSLCDLAWSISLMFCLVGITYFSLTSREGNPAVIEKVTDYLHTRLCVLSLCSGILFACIFRQKIVEVVENIATTDKELQVLELNFDLKEKYKMSKIYLVTCTVTLWTYILGLFVLDIAAFTTLNIISIGQFFAYAGPILTTFIELQFCTLVLLLRERFSWLNGKMLELGKYFEGNTHCDDNKLVSSSKIKPIYFLRTAIKDEKDKILATVQQISIHHYQLCIICKKLNKAYSFQILLIIVQAFLTIIAVTFYLARHSFSNTLHLISLKSRIYYINMIIVSFVIVVVLVVVCSNTVNEAQKTGLLLHKAVPISATVNGGSLDLGVACFSLQLLHHKLDFTACRLFIINETLLYTIIGAAATYLVIVLQFELGVAGSLKENT